MTGLADEGRIMSVTVEPLFVVGVSAGFGRH
jgi:hypothetical protein